MNIEQLMKEVQQHALKNARLFNPDINLLFRCNIALHEQADLLRRAEMAVENCDMYREREVSDGEITKLLSCVRYLTGIAERGMKRPIRDDESVESFVLRYVQSLEAKPSDDALVEARVSALEVERDTLRTHAELLLVALETLAGACRNAEIFHGLTKHAESAIDAYRAAMGSKGVFGNGTWS